MKKLLLFLALAAAGLQGRAEDLYLVGSALSIGYNIDAALRATTMTETGTNVFEWTGYFKNTGDFKILTKTDSWDDNGYNPLSSPVTLTSDWSSVGLRTEVGDNKWKISTSGTYKITINTSTKQIKAESVNPLNVPTISGDYYLISSANDLVNFANAINRGQLEPNVKAKLTQDINMSGRTDFTPICCANAIKFSGEFDGQGHTITNLTVDYGTSSKYSNCTGFFGYLTTGALVKDLVIGSGCSFKGQEKVGGLVGSADGSGEINITGITTSGSMSAVKYVGGVVGHATGGATVKLTNVINSADVDATGGTNCNVAGLVGYANKTDGVITKVIGLNCANLGAISNSGWQSDKKPSAAFISWAHTGTSFTNCWNIGTISNYEIDNNKKKQLYRASDDIQLVNCFDLSGLTDGQGTSKDASTATSGELCFLLNNSAQGGTNWYQNLAPNTADSHPMPFSTHKKVYMYSDALYTNLEVSSSKIQISDAKDMQDFASLVNAGNTSLNAELTGDIDMKDVSYTPIGTESNSYTGTFDGKGNRIKNLVIDTSTSQQALFRRCGAATIQNLIIDSSCSFRCTASSDGSYSCAAFVAGCYSPSAATLTFENCGNEANVYGAHYNSAAFLGFNYGNVTVSIRNCYNKGNISGGKDNCAFIGWNAGKTYNMTNCYNIGTVIDYNSDNNFWGRSNGTKTISNCYTTGACNALSGLTVSYSSDKVSSGELCYKLGNGATAGTWTQTIGTDAYPVPFNTSQTVNQVVADESYTNFATTDINSTTQAVKIGTSVQLEKFSKE